jgi:ABC-type antimicrobial peptide transport system permease subunit
VGQGLSLVALGVALGLVLALALASALRSLLFGISPSDPNTLLLVTIALAGVALIASWLPARRASRLDPLAALRVG